MAQSLPQIDLSGLKDLHYGLKPDFWPLAEGWYLLIGGLFLMILMGIFWWKKYQQRPLPYALKELGKIKTKSPEIKMKLLSQLLKRVAMVKYERKEIAPLSEDQWQAFLLAAAPDLFTKEQAKNLAFAIYNQSIPDENLFKSCQKWIKAVLKKQDIYKKGNIYESK